MPNVEDKGERDADEYCKNQKRKAEVMVLEYITKKEKKKRLGDSAIAEITDSHATTLFS